MRFDLAGGWHLLRVEVNGRREWIICDPIGDRLGGTDKHKSELDVALMAELGSRTAGPTTELAPPPRIPPVLHQR